MSNFVNVVECAIEYDNKFFIIKRPTGVHGGGLLSFPGGKLDYTDENGGNILIEAAKREIFEETGLKLIDPLHFVTSCYFQSSPEHHVLDVLFYCKIIKTELTLNVSAREVPEYFWLTLEECLTHPCSPPWMSRYINALVIYLPINS